VSDLGRQLANDVLDVLMWEGNGACVQNQTGPAPHSVFLQGGEEPRKPSHGEIRLTRKSLTSPETSGPDSKGTTRRTKKGQPM
jgi:hypothetical protein